MIFLSFIILVFNYTIYLIFVILKCNSKIFMNFMILAWNSKLFNICSDSLSVLCAKYCQKKFCERSSQKKTMTWRIFLCVWKLESLGEKKARQFFISSWKRHFCVIGSQHHSFFLFSDKKEENSFSSLRTLLRGKKTMK